MRLKQYYIHQEKYEQTPLFDQTIEFIKKSFLEITDMYSKDNDFRKTIEWDLKSTIISDEDLQVFYIIQDNKEQIIWCLWWMIYERKIQESDIDTTNMFLSNYVSIDKNNRKKWLWTLLKINFEKFANEKRVETYKNTVIWSCVHKNNILSQQRNLKNWYVTKNHWNQPTDSEYIKYYKGDY